VSKDEFMCVFIMIIEKYQLKIVLGGIN